MDLKEAGCGVDTRTHWCYRTKRRPLDRYVAKLLATNAHGLDIDDVGSCDAARCHWNRIGGVTVDEGTIDA